MNWRVKALIQSSVALLPKSLSYRAYYSIQRRFGNLAAEPYMAKAATFAHLADLLERQNIRLDGISVFEVGTGRIPAMPLFFWLSGAGEVVTADLNPYLMESLTKEFISLISQSKDQIRETIGPRLHEDRLDALCRLASEPTTTLDDILRLANIKYLAPTDAGATDLPDSSIDLHFSNCVFEHIDEPNIVRILNEGRRIVKPNGTFIHHIDYSDHFSHSDRSISAINFLKYSDWAWHVLAGNRFMYCNRLRHDDFLGLYEKLNHRIVHCEASSPDGLLSTVHQIRPSLFKRFGAKSDEVLATTSAVVISKAEETTVATNTGL